MITTKKKKSRSYSKADEMFEEMEEKGYMIRSEDLKWNEDLLCIWGYKFPKEKEEAKNAIHHALIHVDSLASKEKFRVIYFHSDVKGAGTHIPKLIK